ncbi:GNAT family N-acetyltransferase [Desulfoprunum benzoelyticum]|uniref:GNAT superfamily N-acetyltransferase n=1 Tax=Desulfoprunum benzoelyticum TaxID=1506996 RepID=A0A840V1I3_9BACT|nr:GNAT family N-acetyltransferase [Desulfoprunum benzoelyticum]MBB5347700.1 GNAT superfamily N-acetyltransferase [Desulfoprunum benzoelyticum]MBM9529293.1 GNAT family N-acetyltransferase [Desulfoprunum benzoelyticum]
MGRLTAPEPITPGHGLDQFDCGIQTLNQWLQRQALINETTGASRTFVTCDHQRVVGFYALATGSVRRGEAPGRVKRGMPDPLPVMVLGRLAVARHWQKHGVGAGLLKDAVLRTLTVSRKAGIRALLVHALSESAKDFYLRYGFRESPFNPMTLMLNLTDWDV